MSFHVNRLLGLADDSNEMASLICSEKQITHWLEVVGYDFA